MLIAGTGGVGAIKDRIRSLDFFPALELPVGQATGGKAAGGYGQGKAKGDEQTKWCGKMFHKTRNKGLLGIKKTGQMGPARMLLKYMEENGGIFP